MRVFPQWTISTCQEMANLAEAKISSKKMSHWLSIMYGEKPNDWHNIASEEDKFRYTINALTRMRYCFQNGQLEFDCKNSPNEAPQILKPWFELPHKEKKPYQWVFGHWAALMGKTSKSNIHALSLIHI